MNLFQAVNNAISISLATDERAGMHHNDNWFHYAECLINLAIL